MEWNEETIGRLRNFWAEGHSTAEIGRRLGVSKNAVVGKAHRLELPPRPSPIRRGATGSERRRLPRRVQGPTLPSLSTSLPPMPPELPRIATRPIERHEPPIRTIERDTDREIIRAPMLRAVPTPRTGGRVTPCCWPIGEPGTRSFRFCDVNAIAGKPYCEDHAALAYVKVRDRKEDAA